MPQVPRLWWLGVGVAVTPAPAPVLSNEESHRGGCGAGGLPQGGALRAAARGLRAPHPRGPLLPAPTLDKSTFCFPEEDPELQLERGTRQPLSFQPRGCAGAGWPGAPEGPRLCPETDSGSGSTGGAAGARGPGRLPTPAPRRTSSFVQRAA